MRWRPRFRRRARVRKARSAVAGTAPSPLARTAKAVHLVAGGRRIGVRSRDPRLSEGALVHERSPIAPTGFVFGVATPTRRPRRHLALIFRRRDRRRGDSAPSIAPQSSEDTDTIITARDDHGAIGAIDHEPIAETDDEAAESVSRLHHRPVRMQKIGPTLPAHPETAKRHPSHREEAERLPPVPLVGNRSLRSLSGEANATESVPAETRSRIGRRFGVDLSEVVAQRGAASADAASRLGARAFTRGDEIHLPARHGEFGSTEADALAAHELTHVAQRRIRGPDLPPETSAVGRILEAQARGEEDARRGPHRASRGERSTGAGAPPPVPFQGGGARRAPPSPSVPVPEQTRRAPADRDGGDPTTDGFSSEDLFDRLYERIRGRLRHELLIDRERAGLLNDPS